MSWLSSLIDRIRPKAAPPPVDVYKQGAEEAKLDLMRKNAPDDGDGPDSVTEPPTLPAEPPRPQSPDDDAAGRDPTRSKRRWRSATAPRSTRTASRSSPRRDWRYAGD